MTGRDRERYSLRYIFAFALVSALGFLTAAPAQAQGDSPMCYRNFYADVVVLDMPLMFNRMGAQNINGMMYALRSDVVDKTDFQPIGDEGGVPGNVTLRPDKRPRPLVLRMGAGDCMTVKLTNLLTTTANHFEVPAPKDPLTNCSTTQPPSANEVRSGIEFTCEIDDQVAARGASLHFQGVQLFDSIMSDGSNVGNNSDSLVYPGQSREFTFYSPEIGEFLGTSRGGVLGGEGFGGQTASGLFATLNVSPKGAVFYRNAVANEDLELTLNKNPLDDLDLLAVDGDKDGYVDVSGHPIINYEATYPTDSTGTSPTVWDLEGKGGKPVLNMYDPAGNAVHTAIDAIVAYGGQGTTMTTPADGENPVANPFAADMGHFPTSIYPLEAAGHRNPTVPSRLEPFREFTVIFHDETSTAQAFPAWFEDPVFSHTLHGVRDKFMINYGSGGIGSEIIGNRLRVGAMHDCANCAYEEFFLTFHAVGEVGQLADIPANFGLENCGPDLDPADCGAVGPKANYILYPDDPSNVHHGYIGDQTAFRNYHAGPGEQHVFHLHNHQWLWNANDDNSNYLDAQGLGPGSGYGYWINFSGSGNRNKTAGDAIFHCHFYPHFAQGMWEMWRIHDTFEPGTELAVSQNPTGYHEAFNDPLSEAFGLGLGNGTPTATARALPDGEIVAGAPTPAVIPLPGKPMAPMPAEGVQVVANDNTIKVCTVDGLIGSARVAPLADGTCPVGNKVDDAVGSLAHIDRAAATVDGELQNPGYPFWIAGMEHTVGNRPPSPPLDMLTASQAEDLYDATPGALWSHPGLNADNTARQGVPVIDGWDGGLPRFAIEGYSAGSEAAIAVTRLDMSKVVEKAKPVFFPEEGTDLEQVAMRYHMARCHDTFYPDGVPADCNAEVTDAGNPYHIAAGGFVTNGAPPIAGAPFQEPCIDDRGALLGPGVTGKFFGGELGRLWDVSKMTVTGSSPHNATAPRYYKAANVQFDAVFNKQGYHFPQERIITLWQDVIPTIKQERPPEPMVLRMNTFDCTQYVHSNVVPKAYELDDYQVRTPTDIIGQHIHLPKWDLTSADGSANGWNYEDGTLSPEAVVEMIEAINAYNTSDGVTPVTSYPANILPPGKDNVLIASDGHDVTGTGLLEPAAHPYFGNVGEEFAERFRGARSTTQRWFADPVANIQGIDRGLGIIFTHDHYGPSTHQQVGLYATVLIEPAGAKWVHNEEGQQLGIDTSGNPAMPGRLDGGPTSWQAAILTGSDGWVDDYADQNVGAELIDNHREFYFEYSDFQHAYQPEVFVGIGSDGLPIYTYYHPELAGGDHPGFDTDGDGFIDQPIDDALGNVPSAESGGGMIAATETFRHAIQPPFRLQASLQTADLFPVDIWDFPAYCLGTVFDDPSTPEDETYIVPRPCAEAITADDPGMYVVNYRNESIAARIYDPNRLCPDGKLGCQAEGISGDLALAMSSQVPRAIPELNTKMGLAPAGYSDGVCSNDPTNGGTIFCPPINSQAARNNRDPFTPIVRAFDGDPVHIKMQAGGQEEEHTATLQALSWLQAGSGFGEAKNSGWRNAQAGGISEQFSLRMPIYADTSQRNPESDSFYSFNASFDGWASGTWGIVRQEHKDGDLVALSDDEPEIYVTNASDFVGVCPADAYVREYDLTAVQANDVLPIAANVTVQDHFEDAHVGAAPVGNRTLVYNPRTTLVAPGAESEGGQGPLHDPTAMLYVNTSDLVTLDEHYHEVYERQVPGKRGKGGFIWEAFGPENGWAGALHEITDWSGIDDRCYYMKSGGVPSYDPTRSDCPVVLRHGAPIEPMVVRANAGDCITVNLRNKVLAPATYEDDYGVVRRVYKGTDFGSPAFFAAPGNVYTADLNGDGVLDAATESLPHGDIDWDQTLDLATGNAISATVRRDPGLPGQAMTAFQNNMMQPSARVGLQPQLVEYDVTTAGDGVAVGSNVANQAVEPGAQTTYRWYAGRLAFGPPVEGDRLRRGKRNVRLTATPIEFGGFNIMPTDKIEQGQKGLVAAGVIYPAGSTWDVELGRHTEATVYSPAVAGFREANDDARPGIHTFDDFTTIAGKGMSMFYGDTYPIENIEGEGEFGVAEDAQDMGHMHINYGNEAMWFRFGTNPTVAGGNAACPDGCLGSVSTAEARLAYSNALGGAIDPATPEGAPVPDILPGTGIGDPETAVFTVGAGDPFRVHVLMPTAPGRGSTYELHGHSWQRDPYVCFDDSDGSIAGKCDMGNGVPGSNGTGKIGSRDLGRNPLGFYLGGVESWFASQHYEIVIPRAGGDFKVPGDYLFRDQMGLGNTGGLWGIVRVEPAPAE